MRLLARMLSLCVTVYCYRDGGLSIKRHYRAHAANGPVQSLSRLKNISTLER